MHTCLPNGRCARVRRLTDQRYCYFQLVKPTCFVYENLKTVRGTRDVSQTPWMQVFTNNRH